MNFGFAGVEYTTELSKQAARSKELCAIKCCVKVLQPAAGSAGAGIKVLWMEHDFAFFGGSLGCAEGEKLTRGFEYALANKLPVVIKCATGGARMHEGTLSLMQMAKVSCAVKAHGEASLPFITLLVDPCYGGVSASYAMQADVRIGVVKGRLGFSGPAVILNTQYGMNQGSYDKACPDQFQSNEFGLSHGYVDLVVDKDGLEASAWKVLSVMCGALKPDGASPPVPIACPEPQFDYTSARALDRIDANDILKSICDSYIELGGDGK